MGRQAEASSSARTETMQHAIYHGDPDTGFRGLGQAFIVFVETAVATEPRKCAFHDPTAGQNLKALRAGVVADDAQIPVCHLL